MYIKVIKENCVTGHVCPMVKKCPRNAIEHIDISVAPTVNIDLCTVCGKCTSVWCKSFVLEYSNK